MTQNFPLDSRSQSILNTLLNSHDYITVNQLAQLLNVSRRSIYYDLCKINDWLVTVNVDEIQIERNKGLYLSEPQKDTIHSLSTENIPQPYFQFLPMERISIIILRLLTSKDAVNVDELMGICLVSRNTIIADMNVVKTELNNFDLKVVTEKRNGIRVRGNAIKKRSVFLFHFNKVIELYHRGVLIAINVEDVNENLRRLKKIECLLDTRYVEGALLSLAVLLSQNEQPLNENAFKDIDVQSVIDTREYVYTRQIFHDFDVNEVIYIAIHLLGSRIQVTPNLKISSKMDQEMFELTRNLISEFERIACIEFSERQEIERAIFVHLKMSLYRYRYGVQIGNPLVNQIKSNYPELFQITKDVMQYVSKSIGVPISDNEAAYLTLHFGGHMKAGKHHRVKLQVGIYCPDSVATSKMLQKEIESLSTDLQVHQIVSTEQLSEADKNVNIIISTVTLREKIPTIKVNPILTEEDKANLVVTLSKYINLGINPDFIDGVISVISKYVAPSNYKQLKNELTAFFKSQMNRNFEIPIVKNPSMIDIMSESDIQVFNEEKDWRASIQLSSQPLLDSNKISQEYIDKMVGNIVSNGPYIYLEPGLAIAHSRPEDGVSGLGLAMGIFKKGIYFSEELVANVILVLAPIDHETHLKILREIMAFFGVQTNYDEFINCKKPSQAYALIDHYIKNEFDNSEF